MGETTKHAITSKDEWEAFCKQVHGEWDKALDVNVLSFLAGVFNGMRTSEAMSLLGVLAINVIAVASETEDEACNFSRALGQYVHDRTHANYEAIKTRHAVTEKKGKTEQ